MTEPNATKPEDTWSGNVQCPNCLFFLSGYAPTEEQLDGALFAGMKAHVDMAHPGSRLEMFEGIEVDMKVPPAQNAWGTQRLEERPERVH